MRDIDGIRSMEGLIAARGRPLLTCLRRTGQPVRLLIEKPAAATPKHGVRRIVNDHRPLRRRVSA